MLLPRRVTIYEEQLPTRTASPAHEGEFALNVLEGVRVAEVLKPAPAPTVFTPATPLREVLSATAGTTQRVFPVVDPERGLVGVVSADDLRIFLTEHAVAPDLLVAYDLRAAEFRTADPDEDLAAALRKLYATGLDELPVLDEDDPRRVRAMLTRRAIMTAYHGRMYRDEARTTERPALA
jgi:CIC family chloride channel protein